MCRPSALRSWRASVRSIGLMLFLAFGAVSIAAASVREGKLEPGAVPGPVNVRGARLVMAASAVLVLGTIYLGREWWGSEARNYQGFINFGKPPKALASFQPGRRLVLRAQGQDPNWSKWVKPEKFIPDHGHLMHLFLLRLPGMERLWHLHPERIEKGDFAEDLPSMPGGRYQIFADVVDDGGFPWTLVGEIDLPAIAGRPLAGDDSEASAAPISAGALDSTVAELPDGGRMVWERDAAPLKANVPTSYRFRVEDREARSRYGTLHGHGWARRVCALRFLGLRPCSSRGFGVDGRTGTGPGQHPWKSAHARSEHPSPSRHGHALYRSATGGVVPLRLPATRRLSHLRPGEARRPD